MRRTGMRVDNDSDDEFTAGVQSVLFIRCMKHRNVPQFNANEHSGGECGGCLNEAGPEWLLSQRDQLAGDVIAMGLVVDAAKQLIAVIDSEPDGPILKADGQPPWAEVSELIRALVESRSLEHPDEPNVADKDYSDAMEEDFHRGLP